MKKKYICFVAGKSGGHLLPCITKAQQLIKENKDISIIFFTTQHALDKTILSNYSFIEKIIYLPIKPFAHKKLRHYPAFIFALLHSFFISLFTMYRYKPINIISMGGLISLPVCVAGTVFSIPIQLYELNVIPGKASQALAPLAQTIFVCFTATQQHFKKRSTTLAPYPLRFSEATKKIDKIEACQQLMLNPSLPTLFILGGSQGSLLLNQTIKAYAQAHPNAIQIIHQTGNQDAHDWQKFYATLHIPAFVFSFYHNLEYCYQAADLMICRAGAGTLFELLFFKKKSIVIPLETSHNNHQLFNAQTCAQEYPHLITVVRHHELSDEKVIFSLLIQQNLAF